MTYEVAIQEVPEQLLAAAKERMRLKRVSRDIRRLLEAPWALVRARGDLRTDGHNVAVYWDWTGKGVVEAGIQIVKPFEATDLVVCSATPAGSVAATTHLGPYQDLHLAHRAVRDWCAYHGHQLAGPAWEIYGDWADDPAQLRTDVQYLLG